MFVCTNKYYCFLKKRKKKKSTLGTRVTFCFEPIFLYWATLTKQKKKTIRKPNSKYCQEESQYMLL